MKYGKNNEKIKFLIPIIILLLGVGFIFAFEFYIKDKVNTVVVVKAKHEIPFKEKITINDLIVEPVRKDDHVENAYRPDEIDLIVGSYASIKIAKGTQIYPELIDSYDLVPNETKGEFIAPLPNKWLYAVPGSLRKSYLADIYAIGDNEKAVLNQIIQTSHSNINNNQENNQENNTNDFNKENSETNFNEKETQLINQTIKNIYKPILTDIRISSVKDSSNKEVTKAEDSNDENSATATISSLEIIANEKILETIRNYTDNGYKLYIVYKFERGLDEVSKQIKETFEQREYNNEYEKEEGESY